MLRRCAQEACSDAPLSLQVSVGIRIARLCPPRLGLGVEYSRRRQAVRQQSSSGGHTVRRTSFANARGGVRNGNAVAHLVAEAKTVGQLPPRTSAPRTSGGWGWRGMAMTAAGMGGLTVPHARPTTPVILRAIEPDRPVSCVAEA